MIFINLVWVPFFYSTLVSGSLVFDFSYPYPQSRPKFRYWLPDASIPSEVLQQDIADLAFVGAGGLEFLPFYLYGNPSELTPPTDWNKYAFGTPAFKNLFQVALIACQTQQLLFDFAVGANQGQGVPSVPGTNGLAVELIYGDTTILAGDNYNGSLPEGKADFQQLTGFMGALEPFGTNKLVAVIAGKIKSRGETTISVNAETTPGYPVTETVFDESTVIDLTSQVVNGSLNWTPDSNSSYSLMAFYERYTNQRSCTAGIGATDFIGNGSWTVDHFSADGAKRTTDFWDEYLIDDRIKNSLTLVGKNSWEDSMEMQFALPWTPDFLKRFETARGYSAAKYLPLMFNVSNQWGQETPPYDETWVFGKYDSSGKSIHLLDYQKTLNEGYQDYLKHFDQWAQSLGLNHSAQPSYNFPLDMLADVPLVGVPELESLGFGDNIDNYRQFTGPAHLSGRNVISTEVGAVNSAAYSQKIPDLLRLFKDSFAAGINMMVIHGMAYSGEYPETTWPGYTSFGYVYTEQWNAKQPAWRHLGHTLDYTSRNQLILQSGVPKVDLAFYLFKNPWNRGEIYQNANLKTLGYTYEYLTADNLLLPQAVAKSGVLAPDGPAYKALVISSQTHMSLEAAKKLHDFAAAGLPIIFIGNLPSDPISTDRNASSSPLASLQSLVAHSSSVKVLSSSDQLPAYLQSQGVKPRASVVSGGPDVYTVWRTVADEDTELVFIFNRGADTVTQFDFAVENKVPHFFNTFTGDNEPLMIYNTTSSGISTSIELKADQTKVIAFTNSIQSPAVHVQTSTANIIGFSHYDSSVSALSTGPGTITLSNGNTITVNATDFPPLTITPWTLSMQSFHPTSNIKSTQKDFTDLPPINLTSLAPWTEIPGLQQVSGIGTYNTVFSFPYDPSSVATIIEFGPILNTVQAFLNGFSFPPIDPTDPKFDISNWVQKGDNSLAVEVTSSLFNAVKARKEQIMTAGVPLTTSNPEGYEGDWAEFGLLGPVVVRCYQKTKLDG